jgi:hypothetical protein
MSYRHSALDFSDLTRLKHETFVIPDASHDCASSVFRDDVLLCQRT